MSRRIIFFINPVSGTRAKITLEKKIINACTLRDISFEILFTSADGQYHFLREKTKQEGITDVVICGGDGSISPVIAALLPCKVNIGIVPVGSGNGLARAAGIPMDTDKALQLIFEGNAASTDAILINGRLCCHLCGLGFDAQVAHDFARQKTRGLSTYIKETTKNFIKAPFWSFDLVIENKTIPVDAFLLCVANSNQFGNNITIAPQASLSDGLMDIVVIKQTNRPRLLFEFARQLLSGKIIPVDMDDSDNNKVLYYQSSAVTIKNKSSAPLHIDGDPVTTADELVIEMLPSAYRLIQP